MTEWWWKVGLRWLIIAAPIIAAKAFGLLDGGFSRPAVIALGLCAALAVIISATFTEALWQRKRQRNW